MDPNEEIDMLLGLLQRGRDTLVWKLEGLSEFDARRPLTPTGTNLLGIVKHVAAVEHGYLTECFGRDAGLHQPWLDEDAPDNTDMWATADESREWIVSYYQSVQVADDAAAHELGLDARGTVPWWGDRGKDVTMRRLIVHMIAETNRHAGHADIVRELIDGSVGFLPGIGNMPTGDEQWWSEYTEQVEAAAREAAARETAAEGDPHA